MRIAVFDSWNGKFSSSIVNHWNLKGHQAKLNPRFEDAIGADVNFFYQSDNVAIEGTKNRELTGRTYVQCVDIEVWAGQAAGVNWDKVNGGIFIAKHIKDMVERQVKINCPTKLIRPGIDADKWTLKPHKNALEDPTRKIVYIVGDKRIWDVKRLDIAFQLLRDCLDADRDHIWQLHIRGTYSSHEQYNAYCKHLQQDLNLNDFVVWYPDRIENLNSWLDDKDYFVLPSTKEAFSYATAETMAKGIKPIIGNWQGAKETWGKYVCDTYGQMLRELLNSEYKSEEYRNYVRLNYDESVYFEQLDNFMGIGGELHD